MFLIRSLGPGGAERQLVTLAKGLRSSGHDIIVVTFYSSEWFQEELEEAGIQRETLGKRGRWDIIRSTLKLIALVQKTKPNILHSYLTTANLLALLPKTFRPSLKLVWGVRASNVDFKCYDRFAKLSFQCECLLSTVANLIIANSHAGREYHMTHGFPKRKMVVIHNGIDTEHFTPDEEAARRVRREWGIKETEKLVGHIGRLDPMKDHITFLEAAALLSHDRNDLRFVCVGEGPNGYRDELQILADKLKLTNRLIWAGLRRDMPGVYNALDLAVSSSRWGEGLPNVIVEAMACCIPCVVTDVGDSAFVVDELGSVVKAGNPKSLADAIDSALTGGIRKGSAQLRERVKTLFSMNNCLTESLRALNNIVQ